MSKLEKLIQQYCPDGVEYVRLGDVMSIQRGASPRPIQNYLTDDEYGIPWIKIGDVSIESKYITSTKERVTKEGAAKSRFLKRGSFILSNSMSFGRPYILEIDGCIHDGWISMCDFEKHLLPDFLYYLLRSSVVQDFWISKANSGGAVTNLNSDIVRSTLIPVPPLPVQEEIVRVLDTFTELQAELQAELQKRKQQYNFYLDNLLNFKNINRGGEAEVRWMKLKNVCMKTSNIKWKSTTGQYRYIDLSSVDIQTHSIISTIEIDKMSAPSRAQQIVQEDDVIFATTRPTQMRACIIPTEYNGDICSTGYCILRADRNILLPKFLFFSMTTSTFKIYLSNNLTLGNYPSISNSALMGYEIPVPPIAEQQKIVSILDRFDTLTNDLTSGLPAEMEKRRQQYEFYRDKLLTFKRKEA